MKIKLIIILYFFSVSAFGQKFVKTAQSKSTGEKAEAFRSFTSDGAWCWFSDPRAIYYEGNYKRTYSGWVTQSGDVVVGYYDHESKNVETHILHKDLQTDDHNNPALLFDDEGKLKIFYSKHGAKFPIQFLAAKSPEDIFSWEPAVELALNDMETYAGLNDSYTYQNPVYLSEEDKLYLFWRGADFKPNFSISEDGGKSWSKGRILILPERIYKNRRPYLKVYGNGKDKIHFAFTDGHPRNEKNNSIYYMYYKDNAYYKANGEKIKNVEDGPVEPREASVVYDAIKEKNPKSWIWDVAEDQKGNPVVAYAKFPDDKNHIYSYARWEKDEWNNYDLINSGNWFPQTPEGATEPEPNYSAGLSINKEDPSVLYLSVKRNGIFEIEKWSTRNGGRKWKIEPVTTGSIKDNVRPFAVLNAGSSSDVKVLWMHNTHYRHYVDFNTAIKMDQKTIQH